MLGALEALDHLREAARAGGRRRPGGAARRARARPRARLMTGGWYRLLASANFGELVLGCINADFCKQILYDFKEDFLGNFS